MAIKITCSACGKNLNVRDELAGKRVRCPACQAPITIPDAPSASAHTDSNSGKNPPITKTASSERIAPTSASTRRTVTATSSSHISGRHIAPAPHPAVVPITAGSPVAPAPAEKPITSVSAGNRGDKNSTFCPSCKKRVPTNILICPHCSWHFKLKKKVNNLSQAIQQADFRSQGLSRDGKAKANSIVATEQRAGYTRKIRAWSKVAIALVLALICVFFGRMIYNSTSNIPLADLRQQYRDAPATGDNFNSWQPVWVYTDGDQLLSCQIPFDQIKILRAVNPKDKDAGNVKLTAIETPLNYPEKWPHRQRAAGARFVETVLAPIVDTIHERTGKSRYNYTSAKILPTITGQINRLGGPYAPKNLDDTPPYGRIFIWRKAVPTDSGGLRGALLVLNENQENELIAAMTKWREAIAKREANIAQVRRRAEQNSEAISEAYLASTFPAIAMPQLQLSAKLSFTPFANKDMLSGNDGYAGAATAGSIRLKRLNAPPRTRVELRNLGDPNACFFAPVLIAETIDLKIKN